MWRKVRIPDKMQKLLSYQLAFGEDHGFRFVGVCIVDGAKDSMSSVLFAANFRNTYIRKNIVGKTRSRNCGVLFSFEAGKDVVAAGKLYITHLDETGLYISSAVDMLLMIQAADPFVQSIKSPPFSTPVLFLDMAVSP